MALRNVGIRPEYRSGDEDLVESFYKPCLQNALIYKRAVGYFRSSVFVTVEDSLLDFALRGGKIQLVCSPELAPVDIEAIQEGYVTREEAVAKSLSAEVQALLDRREFDFRMQLLATLIKCGTLDVQVALRPDSYGQYHEKLGIFIDAESDSVSFKGSSNETWSGWHPFGNYESFDVFCSWHSGSEADRVERHLRYFEDLWANKAAGVDVMPFPEAAKQRLLAIARDDIRDFVREPEPSGRRRPLPHQTNALENWEAAGRRGLLQHATGSGKTFTGILAIARHLESGGASLVVVPSRLLLRQWNDELKSTLPGLTILKAGDGNNGWRVNRRLQHFTAPSVHSKRVVLATMQTASSPDFLNAIRGGSHLMLVADEVHQLGSSQFRTLMALATGARLGLSATPKRFGDPVGTSAIFEYFGKILDPVIGIPEAIRSGRLVPYIYRPHFVNLNNQEAEEWRKLSAQIRKEVAVNTTSPDDSRTARIERLLFQRSAIAKKASSKMDVVDEALSEYERGQRWLIYCEDQSQMNDVVEVLRRRNVYASVYHSNMASDRDAAFDWFREEGGIVVAIRCLDEGVDVPAASHALILASSQNPRQFIQRRGRVLRTAPGKYLATIHDAIVVPLDIQQEPDQASLARSEFARALEFAQSALNKDADAAMRNVAAEIGLNIGSEIDDEVEETPETED